MGTVVVNTTVAEKMVILGFVVLVSAAIAIWTIRRRGNTDGSDSINPQLSPKYK
jgi:hypothetical protein